VHPTLFFWHGREIRKKAYSFHIRWANLLFSIVFRCTLAGRWEKNFADLSYSVDQFLAAIRDQENSVTDTISSVRK
jgi:hypothetical protein